MEQQIKRSDSGVGEPRPWLWGPCSRLGLGLALATLVADQAHKLWMLDVYRIGEGQRIRVSPFLDLVYVRNPGISYSLLPNLGQAPLIAFALAATVVLVVWIARAHSRLVALSLGLISGGAVGNAIDRIRLGGVADFFSFHIGSFYWYVFNLADVAIVAGVVGLLYDSLALSRKSAGNED
jgi:signal peptidase II